MSNELTTLSTLAVEIDALNEQANIFANQAVIYAAKSGQKLLLAKAQCNHGQFKSWLDENCKLSYSTAKNYMRLATNNPELLDDSKRQLNVLLPSVTQMIELITAPEEVRTEVTAKIENGEDVTIKEIQRLKKEAADLAHEKQSILLNLAGANDEIAEKQKRINWLEIDRKGVIEQNDKLRNRDQALIDAKVAEAKAQLILENQQAIAENKRIAENAIADLERLKKDRDNQIKMGVSSELQKYETEIAQKTRQIEYQKQELEKMMNVKRELDSEVGTLAIHKKAIEKIKDNLSFLTVSFSDAYETNAVPNEVLTEWQSISYALSQTSKKMIEFVSSKQNAALVGELVD
jgi:DNA repair exonuclease SbcCD ATPase subunit